MTPQGKITEHVRLTASNIGGIDETEVTLQPGVTILSGGNTTNRTSLLQAIMAALGGRQSSLKADADKGIVTLEIDGKTYTRTLERQEDQIVMNGEPYLDNPELAELFAFLLESNEARQAVVQKQDLRELIMRPVDTDAINEEIKSLKEEKREIDQHLDELGTIEREIPNLKQERNRIERQIEEKADELAEAKSELEETDTTVKDSRERQSLLEEKFEDLKDLRNRGDRLGRQIDSQENSLDALAEEREELEAKLDSLSKVPMGEVDEIDSEIQRLRGRIQELTSTVSHLQTVVQFNEEMLEGDAAEISAVLEADGDVKVEDLTDRLVTDTVVCWTCGSDVEGDQIESTVEQLRNLHQAKVEQRQELEAQIDELQDEQSEYESQQREREHTQRRLSSVEDEVEDRTETLEGLEEEREEVAAKIEELEDEVEDIEQDDDHSESIELHKQVNQLEIEHERLQDERDEITEEIETKKSSLDERDGLEKRREEISDELEELQTRIERIETEAIEEFNENMDTVLSLLGYENIDRIWIERVQHDVRDGRRKVTKNVFELHIVRSTDADTVYEDSIDHLSESEREVTGLVFALAGYLVHDGYEVVPFMLLDSIEAIDSDRITALVEHFEQYADYLVVALLTEDAAALDDRYRRITEI